MDKATKEDEPPVPEPERDAQLEEAYKLEKEDADSDEEESDDDDADDSKVNEDVVLTKEQKRELEVCYLLSIIFYVLI